MEEYKKNKVGEIHKTNNYGEVKIIEQLSCNDITIEFLEDGSILQNQKYGSVVRGAIKNPYKKLYYGEGYVGKGNYSNKNAKEAGKRWQNMMQRCYDGNYHLRYPSYKNVTICEEWKDFQNFAKWYGDNWKPYMEGWVLDKDLLSGDNKIYSPTTCIFVPQIINSLLVPRPIKIQRKKNRYYPYISKGNDRRYLEVCFSEEEAVEKYSLEKIEYTKEVIKSFDGIISDDVLDKVLNTVIQLNKNHMSVSDSNHLSS